MPEAVVIVDSGPLVAFLVREDAYHSWAVERFRDLPAPFLTCEPVLTEAFHLVTRLDRGPRSFFDLLDSGLLRVDFAVLSELDRLRRLVSKYADQPMSLADACLVRMSELHPNASVFTLDGHFRLYRRHGRQRIPALMPADR